MQCDLAMPCDPRVRCNNMSPGFRCDPCPPGFTGSQGLQGIGVEFATKNRQRCYDINECNDGRNGRCVINSHCVNTEVSDVCTRTFNLMTFTGKKNECPCLMRSFHTVSYIIIIKHIAYIKLQPVYYTYIIYTLEISVTFDSQFL